MHMTPASPTLLHTMTLSLIIFFSLFSASNAQASTARGMALAEQLMLKGKPLSAGETPYRSILKEKAYPLSSLPPPSRDGFSVYALESDFADRGEVTGAWRAPGEPTHCYVDDGAMVVRRQVKAPKKKGVYRYRWKFSSPGSAEALIEWEYRVLSPDYARLLVRVNGGTSRGVYGGEPVGSLDLTSGISTSLLC